MGLQEELLRLCDHSPAFMCAAAALRRAALTSLTSPQERENHGQGSVRSIDELRTNWII
jgi:hypothetical protein